MCYHYRSFGSCFFNLLVFVCLFVWATKKKIEKKFYAKNIKRVAIEKIKSVSIKKEEEEAINIQSTPPKKALKFFLNNHLKYEEFLLSAQIISSLVSLFFFHLLGSNSSRNWQINIIPRNYYSIIFYQIFFLSLSFWL